MLDVDADIEARARGLLAETGQLLPPFCARRVLELTHPGTSICGAELPVGVQELVTMTAAGPLVLYQRRMPVPERRAAIAHAAAHVLLGDFEARDRSCTAGSSGHKETEERAEKFAAAILVPLNALDAEFRSFGGGIRVSERELATQIWLDRLDHLSELFNVPCSMILKRTSHLATFNEKQR